MKHEEDEDLEYNLKRPSVYRDFLELKAIIKTYKPAAGCARPSGSFVKVTHARGFRVDQFEEVHGIFLKHPILMIDTPGSQQWDRPNVEDILQLSFGSSVPVHSEFPPLTVPKIWTSD